MVVMGGGLQPKVEKWWGRGTTLNGGSFHLFHLQCTSSKLIITGKLVFNLLDYITHY